MGVADDVEGSPRSQPADSAPDIGAYEHKPPAEVWVDDDFDANTPDWGVDHFNKIQDGIDVVVSSGTVSVASGTYTENVELNKALNIAGDSNIDGTLTLISSVAMLGSGITTAVISSGDLTLVGESTLAIKLNGATPGTEHDQINVTGTVAVSGAVLDVTLGFTPPVGTSFVFINNDDDADPITGEFQGLPDGSTLALTNNAGNNLPFVMDYQGADGNDVVLSVVPPATVYVDDDFPNPVKGEDPDGHGPATVFGYDAYETIQEGIDAVAGSTLNVAAGTYHENLNINRTKNNLAILGEDKTTTMILVTGSDGVQIHADGVTFDGFTVKPNAPDTVQQTLGIMNGASGNTISNCIFDGTGSTKKGSRGILVRDNDNTIDNVESFGWTGYGIDVYSGGAPFLNNCTIKNSTIHDNGWFNIAVDRSTNVKIQKCTIFGGGTSVAFFDKADAPVTGGEVTGCTISRATYDSVRLVGSGVIVADNEIYGSSTTTDPELPPLNYGAIRVTTDKWPNYSANNNTITNNYIHDNMGTGVLIDYGSNPEPTGNVFHFNNIVNNTMGFDASTLTTGVDAENNWWGANDGPDDSAGDNAIQGSGDKISSNVDADPWIKFVLDAGFAQIVADGTTSSDLTVKLVQSDTGEIPVNINHLPQFAKVTFKTDLGVLGSTEITKDLMDGTATATLTSVTTAGTANITTKALDASDQAISGATESTTVDFIAGPLDHIVVTPDTSTLTAGDSQTYTAEAFDQYNNSLGDVIADTTFDILEANAGGNWAENVYTSDKAGQWTVTGTYGEASDTARLTVPIDGDGDGMPDSWEVAQFGDLSHDGLIDTDSDGFTDYEEYLAGTDPNNPGEYPIAPPVVTNVSPIIAANTAAIEITITGSNFSGTTSVSLKSGDTTIELTAFTVVGAPEIQATVPAGTAEGIYDILVISADGKNTFIEDKPTFSIYVPMDLSDYSQSEITEAIGTAGLNADSTREEIIENLNPDFVDALDLDELDPDAGETVAINEAGELSVTLFSGVKIGGTVPVELTLCATPAEDSDEAIDAVFEAGTTITYIDEGGIEQPYTGNINPPAKVRLTDEIAEAIAELGNDAENAVVFTMGNPDERLEVSVLLIYVELDFTLPADPDPPVIYYLEADGSLTLAGVDETTDEGIAIRRGGTVLSTTEDQAAGTITYNFGLLLDHMSTFVAVTTSAAPTSSAQPAAAVGGGGGCFIATAADGSLMEPHGRITLVKD